MAFVDNNLLFIEILNI